MILGTRKTLRVCAVSAAAMGVAGPAYAASGDTVHESTKVNQEMTIKPDARGSGTSVGGVRARATRVSRSGRVLASKALATASTAAPAAGIARSGGCVKNKRRRGFVSYAPRYSRAKTDAYEFQYVFHLYKQSNARRRGEGKAKTKQYEMCAIGGGRAKGGNRLERARSSMAAKTKSSTILGPGDWGKGKEEPSAEASLSFEVPVKPVTISGTLSVHPQDLLTGGQGTDRSKSFGDYSFNQVNGIWQGGSTFRFQGSTNFQGNVAIGLWEYLQSSPGPRFAVSAGLERHCSHPYGIGCK